MENVDIMRVFAMHKSDGFFWFRVFGYGLHVKNLNKRGLTFSQRIGVVRYLKVGKYVITFLKRNTWVK